MTIWATCSHRLPQTLQPAFPAVQHRVKQAQTATEDYYASLSTSDSQNSALLVTPSDNVLSDVSENAMDPFKNFIPIMGLLSGGTYYTLRIADSKKKTAPRTDCGQHD